MAESLIDLENVLRSKKDKLSSQEANFLMTWKENTLRQLTVGAGVGAAIAWSATGNLHRLFRINLAGGAAAITATWRFRKSVNSCIEQILCMDGSRMQKELANIMLRRYPNHPTTTKLISKRFYCEHVFDDSTSDIPKSRWRFRNNFVESPPHPQRTEGRESYDHDNNIVPERKPVPFNKWGLMELGVVRLFQVSGFLIWQIVHNTDEQRFRCNGKPFRLRIWTPTKCRGNSTPCPRHVTKKAYPQT